MPRAISQCQTSASSASSNLPRLGAVEDIEPSGYARRVASLAMAGPYEVLLAKILETFSCPICSNLLIQPCITECGHTFCSSCLREVFSQLLRSRLEKISTALGAVTLPRLHSFAQILPTTEVEVRWIGVTLRAYAPHMQGLTIFSYACPTCDHIITKSPSHNHMVKDALSLLDNEQQVGLHRGDDFDRGGFFGGLFLVLDERGYNRGEAWN